MEAYTIVILLKLLSMVCTCQYYLIFLLCPLIFLIILGEVGQYDSEVARLQVPGPAGQAFLDR